MGFTNNTNYIRFLKNNNFISTSVGCTVLHAKKNVVAFLAR